MPIDMDALLETLKQSDAPDDVKREVIRRALQENSQGAPGPPGIGVATPPPVQHGSGPVVDAQGNPVEPPSTLNDQVQRGLAFGVEQGTRIGVPAVAAYLTRGRSLPLQVGGQLAGTAALEGLGANPQPFGVLKSLGIDAPGVEPYIDTLLTDLGTRFGFGVVKEVARKALPAMNAGKQYIANKAEKALGNRISLEEDVLKQGERATETAANRALGEGVQEQFGQQETAINALLNTGSIDSATVKQLRERVAGGGSSLLKETLEAINENVKRTMALQRVRAQGLGGKGALDARQWVSDLPIPDKGTIDQLYNTVDSFNGSRVPQSVMDALNEARVQIAAKEARIASVVPEASNPALRRLSRPSAAAGEAIPEEAAMHQAPLTSRTAGVALKDTPSMELELQDFIRQPRGTSAGGVKLRDEELFTEVHDLLGRKEAGASMASLLNDQGGRSLQALAEEAQQQGFIKTADTGALLDALRESAGGRPVYSQFKTPPDFRYAGITAGTPQEPPTFQAVRETLVRLGQRIGDARRAVNVGATGAGEELAAYSSLYGALQSSLETAATTAGGELTGAAREALKQANAAFKVYATAEELRGLIEANIHTPKGGVPALNPGAMLDALRKPSNKGLRDQLEGLGILEQLDTFLHGLQQRLAEPGQAMLKARELQQTARAVQRQSQGASEAIGAQAQAEAEMVRSLGQRATAEQQEFIGRLQREKGAIEKPVPSPLVNYGIIPTVAAGIPVAAGMLGMKQSIPVAIGAAATAEIGAIFSRYLMTPQGQKYVGKVMESSGGLVTPDALIVLMQGGKQFAPQAINVGRDLTSTTPSR